MITLIVFPRAALLRTISLIVLLAINAHAAEDLAKWKFFRILELDTSASGANVPGDVRNYPVAVALTAENFKFEQADAKGSDLRFSATKDGDPLAHSIEHFDPTARTALIWVKVPLVRGNTAGQKLYFHWGNSGAATTADSSAVFSTGEGWVGVWHLAEEGGTEADAFKDATANAAHGTGVNLAAGSRVAARLGPGISLENAKTQWVKVDSEKRKLFDLTNKLTFSIWAKARSYPNREPLAKRKTPGYETMFAKGDNSWRLQKFGIPQWHKPPAELVEICVERKAPKGDLCVFGPTGMELNKWYHFVGVHDHPKARIYINGVLDKEETFDTEWKTDDHPVGIGNQSQFPDTGGRAWDGELDEARVLNTPITNPSARARNS